jgi:hypothetical protein
MNFLRIFTPPIPGGDWRSLDGQSARSILLEQQQGILNDSHFKTAAKPLRTLAYSGQAALHRFGWALYYLACRRVPKASCAASNTTATSEQ